MSRQNIDLDLLRTFIAVVDCGSIARALGQLHKTQSTISLQLKRLEGQLNCELFQRQGRNIALTTDGKKLVAYARRMLNLHDETLSKFQQNDNQDQLVIGCPDDYTDVVMPKLIQLLQAQSPEVSVTLISKNSSELRAMLDQGKLDLAILTRAPASDEGQLLYQDEGVWVYADPEQLTERPLKLALFEPTCKFNSTVVDGLEKNQIPYHLVCQTSNSHFLTSLAKNKKAITVLSKKAVPDGLLSQRHIRDFAVLPVIDIALSSKAANQRVYGLSLAEICQALAL
ncbi:MAG: LysR substrate-binding domain-containing protein [Thalassotalea sp.]